MTDVVRIFEYGDSGPTAEWYVWSPEWGDEVRDGYGGVCTLHEVPADLWAEYEEAKEAAGEAWSAVMAHIKRRKVPLP